MKNILAILTLLIVNSVASAQQSEVDISADRMRENVKILSSDFFEGRGTSSNGKTKTINFLKDKLQEMGVQSGNGYSYFQGV